MAIAKVTLNGTTLIDITDTTATASDVAPGKYFYTSDGIKTAGEGSGGGVDNSTGILDGSISGTYSNSDVTTLRMHALSYCKSLTSIILPNVTSTDTNAFYNDDHVTSIFFPKLTRSGTYAMSGMKALIAVSLPAFSGSLPNFFMSGDSALRAVDFGVNTSGLGGQSFGSCSSLETVVLRRTNTIVNCTANNTFNGTPFASGGSGGTVYIPKVLYDHLGDGTALDYRSATNWSTIDGYGTITWAQIEGSIYETQYADGTPIT